MHELRGWHGGEIASGFAGISGTVTGLWDITAYRFTRIYFLRALNSRQNRVWLVL